MDWSLTGGPAGVEENWHYSVFGRRHPKKRRTKFKSFSCAAGIWGYVATMDWQQLVSLAIVGTTAAVLLWSRFGPRKFSLERHAGCSGCAAGSSSSMPRHSVVSRARKGKRPEVIVRMQ
jgi:hypothetical protein